MDFATAAPSVTFEVHAKRRAEFFELVCDAAKAMAFLDSYAPVAGRAA